MPSAWITHCKAVYAKGKKKNPNYKYSQAMKDAKASYKRGAKSSTEEQEAAPKKRRGRKKKKPKNEEVGGGRRRVKKQHTAGLGNVEEGRLAEKTKPVKKRQRKRPALGSQYKNIN